MCSGISLLFWFTVVVFLILFWYMWNIIISLRERYRKFHSGRRLSRLILLLFAFPSSLYHFPTPLDLVSSVFRLSFYICFVHTSRCKSIFLYTIPSYMKNIHILPHVRIVILKSVSENTSEWPVCLFYCLFSLPLFFSQFSLVSSPCIFFTKYWTIECKKLEKWLKA